MNSTVQETQPPSSLRTPLRVDLFGPIHKAIRYALGELLTELGNTTFNDTDSAKRIATKLEDVIQLCENHRAHEDRFIVPALAARLQGALHSIVDAHGTQPRLVAELRALAVTLVDTAPARRALAGRTLYLHFSTFAAELLLHMAEEEQVVQPLFERLFSDDELAAIRDGVRAALSDDEKMLAARFMLPALNPEERALLAVAR